MPAISKQQIQHTFNILCKQLGVKQMPKIDDGEPVTGTYYLDHQPIHGGYRIHICTDESGSERVAFGMERLKAKEFYYLMLGILQGNDFANKAAGLNSANKTESGSNV